MRRDGCGYEWDAMLVGGPADGCMDRAISIEEHTPPKHLFRLIDGNEMNRETLGEKLLMHLMRDSMDPNQRVAVYGLRDHHGEESCLYQYLESTNMGEFRKKYCEVRGSRGRDPGPRD
jgi:hypothetical protein